MYTYMVRFVWYSHFTTEKTPTSSDREVGQKESHKGTLELSRFIVQIRKLKRHLLTPERLGTLTFVYGGFE